MNLLLTTDWHLTDNPKDEYRFKIFDYLEKAVKRYDVSWIIVLGDITEKKDNHSSKLVQMIVEAFKKLSKKVPIMILMGNHDYLADPTNPFFKFLNVVKGQIAFVTEPQFVEFEDGTKAFFVPHIREEKKWLELEAPEKPDYAFIHQTVTGAISESGKRLDGFSLAPMKALGCPVFAGDVHKPHTIEPVTYVGPPYHIRFGDDFKPRSMILNTKTGYTADISFPFPKKISTKITDIKDLKKLDIKEGDKIKLSMELAREEAVEWTNHKIEIEKELKDLGLESNGVSLHVLKNEKRKKVKKGEDRINKSPKEILKGFCDKEDLSSITRDIGARLLEV